MGLIHLYSATSTSFDNNGTPLVTAREAVVKRDEGFQLTFSIPISQNDLHKQVQKEMIVSAMTPDGVNYFRIWDIEKRTTDVKVTALQLLYSLDVKRINPFGGKQHTGDSILQAFANSFKSSIAPYTFSSSITTSRNFYTNEKDDTSTSHNALAILNKITDNWSGELMLNGFDVRMISKLGTKTDALLYEHKNIASFSDSSSMNGIITRIYATATYTPERAEGAKEDPEPVVLTATVDSPLINQYAVIYEATMEYNDARTVAELRTEILKQYSEFNVDKPERTIDVDTNIVDGTAINFGDELVLKYLVHDVDEVIRCVGYEYDPISENYIGVTLGTLEKTFLTKVTEGISSSVANQIDKINKQIQVVQSAANGKNRVTYGPNPVPNPIEGDLWFYHPEGRPDEVELLIYQNGLWLPAPFLTDQDRAEFDQAMTDHYNDALAKIELKDAEYKEIFDAYDKKVVTIDQSIADAATKAQSALEEAGISTDLAQTAKDLATTAQTNASTAITNANQAKSDAQTAIANASTAITNASQAKTDASNAVTDASKAIADAQTALATAGSADTKAGQAIAKANAIPTTITDIIADKNLVNGSYVDTKVDAATGAWSQELVRVEGKLDGLDIGGRNLILNSHEPFRVEYSGDRETNRSYYVGSDITSPITIDNEYTISLRARGNIQIMLYRISSTGNSVIPFVRKNDLSETEFRYFSMTFRPHRDELTAIFLTTGYNTGVPGWYEVEEHSLKLERGNKATDWTPAPEDLYTQEEFKIFNAQYTQDVTGMTGRLTTVENTKLDGSTFQTFKETEYQVTADKVTSTITRVDTAEGKITTQGTAISQNATAIASKADKTVVDTLSGTVATHTTEISQNATAIASKASASSVNTLTGRVSTAETTISQHATSIASKASQTEVDTVKGTVSSHTTLISQNATAISARLTTTQVNNLVDGKGLAKVTYVDAENVITRDSINLGIEKLEAEIDAIEVGASNILVGTKDMSANGNKSRITTDTYKGLVISRGTLNGTYLEVFTTNTPVLDGYVYTMSFYAKASSSINAKAYFYNPNNVVSGKSSTNQTTGADDGHINISVTNTWKRYWVTWEMNSTNTTKTVIIRLLDVPKGTTLEVAGVKLEKGNKATDYSQAPSELMLEKDFTHFKSDLDIELGKITTSVSDITKVGGRLQVAESKIQSTSDAVTTTVTRLDNMKFGARNLLQNSGNPQDIRWWNRRNHNLITPHKHNFFKNGEENLFLLQNTTTTEAFLESDQFLVKPDTVYTLSFYVFNNVHVTSWDVFFLGRSSKSTVYSDIVLYSTSNISSSNKVDYFVWRFKTPPVIYDGAIRFDNNGSKTAGTGANLYIGDIMLVEGTEPMAYQPAPEDTLNTSISQWTVKADEISGLISDVKTNPTGTITGYNSIKNKVDSMSQAIGDDGGKIAQMVMTNQLFSTKVLDTVNVGGTNLLVNGSFENGSDGWEQHVGYIANIWNDASPYSPHSLMLDATGKTNYGLYQPSVPLITGVEYTLSFRIYVYSAGSRVVIGYRDSDIGAVRNISNLPTRAWTYVKKTFTATHDRDVFFVIGSGARFIIDNIQVEKGNVATDWSPAGLDKADQSQVTQLAGSWALTLKSGNDIKTQINASTDAIRLQSKFIHLNGSSLIDNATIKSAHIDTLNANKIVGNTADFNAIRAGVLTADAVTATHIKADAALFETLFSTTSATDRLSAQDAWIKNANIIGINADKITAGTISAARISTSSLANIEIGGTNLIGGSNGATHKNLAYWSRSANSNWTRSFHAFYKNSAESVFYLGTSGTQEVYVASTTRVYVEPNTTYTFSMVGFMNVFVKSVDIHFLMRRKGETSSFTITSHANSGIRLNTSSLGKVTWTFTTPNFADLESGFIRIDNNGTNTSGQNAAIYFTDIKLEKGNKATDYSEAPGDIVNDLRSSGQVVIHGGNIKADTLDVGAITGNTATFISKGFKSLNSQSTINGHAIRIQNSAGEFVEMNNTPELRSDDAGGTAVVLGKGRVHFYDSRGYSKGYVGCDIHTAGSYDFGTFLSKGSGIYRFARMADATQTTYAYYTVKAGITTPSPIITDMVRTGLLPDGNSQQFVAKGNMISQLNGWPNYPNWPTLRAGQQIRYKELTTQTTGDAYETIWKFGPSSQGDWRIYFSKHATFEGGTTGTSDRRLKHDIETTQIEALHHIESLTFKEFRWNRDNKYEPLGLIAQDSGLLRVSDDDMEGIDIQRSIMLGLKGVQELQEIVKAQAEKIKQLEEIINQ